MALVEPVASTLSSQTTNLLLGRGEMANIHLGNVWFPEERDHMMFINQSGERKKKAEIAFELVQRVWARGGAFMKKDKDRKTWSEVSLKDAIIKCQHTLRERKKSSETKSKKKCGLMAPVRQQRRQPISNPMTVIVRWF